jgi:uncharacterized membrane protein
MLVPFLVVLAALVLIPTLLWGFAGPWALPAVLPAFVAAATYRHFKLPRGERATGADAAPGPALRPGVIVLGGLFTVVTGAGALMLMWAAPAPSTIVISSEVVISADAGQVWATVVDLPNRKNWSPWIADAEPIGRGGELAVGSEYRATLALERYTVPAELVVTNLDPEQRFAWHVKPQGGSQLSDINETITLTRDGAVTTRVRYELSYEVPTVLGRVGERIAVRGSVERMAETTADLLRQRVLMPR